MLEEQPQVGHGEHRAERVDGAWHGSQSEVASGQKGMFLMGLSDRDGVLPPGRRREGSGDRRPGPGARSPAGPVP